MSPCFRVAFGVKLTAAERGRRNIPGRTQVFNPRKANTRISMLKSSIAALLLGFVLVPSAQAGCLAGAAAGGVVGHVAGHHGLLGAAVGCAVGHHHAAKERQEQQRQDSQTPSR